MDADHARIARVIRDLLAARDGDASIYPSEVARTLAPDDWRPLMPAVRDVARDLAVNGHIRVTAGDATLDPQADWRGPIRLRRAQGGDAA